MNRLPFAKQVKVVALLTEGNSIRATERLTGTHRDTIMRLGYAAGTACHRLHHAVMRNLQVSHLQLDEMWSFCATKQRHVQPDHPAGYGDTYIWLAIDANRKAIVSYHVGKRMAEDATVFLRDLRSRVLNRPQITSDGFLPYYDAVSDAFGRDGADYAMFKKQMNGLDGPVFGITKEPLIGDPDLDKVSTAFIERANLTVRMHLRRCARRTNAYSKKPAHHAAAIALHLAFYNFVRIHETLQITPAMELGLTDHVWSVAELLRTAEEAPPIEPLPEPRSTGRPPRRLRVVKKVKSHKIR